MFHAFSVVRGKRMSHDKVLNYTGKLSRGRNGQSLQPISSKVVNRCKCKGITV